MKIAAVCGSFHKEEIQRMLEYAENEANINGAEISKIIWVPGSMEVPLALNRLLEDNEVDAAIALGIIERGETQHGLVMGQAVTRSIIELQIKFDKSIGLGIIGPGAEKHHIEPRLEPHARSAVNAVIKMSK
ncbi:MAG: 6,7-dimethyl-8-ribityllumazine synthase [Candidatus Poseidoniales archaeon]|jgi:6,7-dimethyl-8-ribityllumazine synthase|uniref:6,7-dimethyl-8-ribityllumazine synthase n=1 Tax=uncultured Poseidoniia archaeon TaxID=1697135 RepID=A0A1B1TAV7_9ARCH|nr:6,7-dimethyl-8-ribityllumazine synthase (ribH, RIB4) [uncultured Candidatus Thalassoarchaea sp.]MAV19354.1 6,7-dimethyl-8-ribityllumazine synthase [Euryarchaeota archaeon]OUX46538.1 MAG: 6,7-dimethyl-8-ribityllumazine synthase [Euryarchaeota archaeon TMED280]RCH73009.1 MAG: 6,7-dimethyl-8-ribityllumazine synthase [Candidatus Poseidoniales archaeon]MDA7602995.1 6,7-dimethyl-8-ribityllumazine synthase [Euryarchaeota archaeon]|tara:strand:+ start:2744 stop:3139 length:396 start_codon:yes stop_codon:yes gene_type:complete